MTMAVSNVPLEAPEFVDPTCDDLFDEQYQNEEPADGTTAWCLLTTIYLPILFLRLRRSFFGVATLIRSVLLGHCLRALGVYLAPESMFHQQWLQALLGNSSSSAKSDPHAWPPPTLRLLALLTILAFIVHPDGMTWVLLGKLRDGIVTFLHSSMTYWHIVVEDNGIIPTLAAVTTLASLILLGIVLHRTLTPKTPKKSSSPFHNSSTQRKKKRKHIKGGRGRIRGRSSRNVDSKRALDKVDREDDAAAATTASVTCQKMNLLPTELTQEPTFGRDRIMTADTALMDDHSCETASVRSNASALATTSAPSTLSAFTATSLQPEEGKKSPRTQNRRRGHHKTRGRNVKTGADTASTSRDAVRTPLFTHATIPNSKPDHSHVASDTSTTIRSSRPPGGTAPTDDSLFSTPLSSPSPTDRVPHASEMISMSNRATPTLSLFSHEPVSVSNPTTPTARGYPGTPYTNNSSYSAPNPYPFSHGLHSPGKTELAAFLLQAGLGGTACEDLLEDLDGVEALSRFSDAQFELYNVTSDEKARVDWMLSARHNARAAAASTPMRPPPGLAYQRNDAALLSPPRLHYFQGSASNIVYPSRNNMGQPLLGGAQLPSMSLLSSYEVSNNSLCNDEDEDSSQIEAELQELGGQMVGSILDFDG